jgi:PKHD-type hydroxylase
MVSENLMLEPLYGVTWEKILNDDEVDAIHEISKNFIASRGTTRAQELSKHNIDYDIRKSPNRRSDLKWIDYNTNTQWLYEKITTAVKSINSRRYNFELVGCEQIQYTTYNSSEQGEYEWHNDVLRLSKDHVRKLSVVILLSDQTEFFGGSFLVSPAGGKPIQIIMKKGTMIVFPSWIPHCVTPVLEGTRTSLVAWLYGNNFK